MKRIVIDLETTGLNFKEDEIISAGMCVIGEPDSFQYFEAHEIKELANSQQVRAALKGTDIPLKTKEKKKTFFSELSRLCQGAENVEFIFHNGSFDTKFLRKNGFYFVSNSHDTMIMAYLLKKSPAKLSLDALASYYLGIPSWKDDLSPKEHWGIYENMMSGTEDTRRGLLEVYTKMDVETTAELFNLLEDKLKKEDRSEFYYKLMKARRTLTNAEFYGIFFDRKEALVYLEELEAMKEEHLALLNNSLKTHLEIESINWRSSKQVLDVFKKLGLKVIDPVSKKESAGKRVQEMNKDRHEIAGMLYDYKKIDKKITSIEKYITEHTDAAGIINANFNVSNVRTGRLSSSSPNLQQVDSSPAMRKLFKVPAGKALIVGDMAQIEVRMAAHYSQDPTLMKVFTDEIDFYGTIAAKTLGYKGHPNKLKEDNKGLRDAAKVVGLSILYGCGVGRLRNGIKEVTGEDIGYKGAKGIITNYFEGFSGLKRLRKGVDRALTERGFIKNLYGRQVDISPDKIYMTGVNALLQSSASDLLLFRATEFMEKFGQECELLALVHDEILIECEEKDAERLKEELKKIMERTDDINFRIPLKFDVGIGKDWSIK